MNLNDEIKIMAFMNALAQTLMDAGITTGEELDRLIAEKEKILLENLGMEDC